MKTVCIDVKVGATVGICAHAQGDLVEFPAVGKSLNLGCINRCVQRSKYCAAHTEVHGTFENDMQSKLAMVGITRVTRVAKNYWDLLKV